MGRCVLQQEVLLTNDPTKHGRRVPEEVGFRSSYCTEYFGHGDAGRTQIISQLVDYTKSTTMGPFSSDRGIEAFMLAFLIAWLIARLPSKDA